MKTAQNSDLRKVFESNYGRRVSDATWYRFKKVFDSKAFPMTIQNVAWVAQLKKQLPKSDLNISCIIAAIKRTEEFLAENDTTVSGEKFVDFLKDRDIEVHPNTLTKWFKPLHGFRKTRIYTMQDLKPVILAAISYKLRKDTSDAVDSFIVKIS